MRLSWLCEQDASWITLILMVTMMLAAEFGYLAGRWWHPRSENDRIQWSAVSLKHDRSRPLIRGHSGKGTL